MPSYGRIAHTGKVEAMNDRAFLRIPALSFEGKPSAKQTYRRRRDELVDPLSPSPSSRQQCGPLFLGSTRSSRLTSHLITSCYLCTILRHTSLSERVAASFNSLNVSRTLRLPGQRRGCWDWRNRAKSD